MWISSPAGRGAPGGRWDARLQIVEGSGGPQDGALEVYLSGTGGAPDGRQSDAKPMIPPPLPTPLAPVRPRRRRSLGGVGPLAGQPLPQQLAGVMGTLAAIRYIRIVGPKLFPGPGISMERALWAGVAGAIGAAAGWVIGWVAEAINPPDE